MRKLQYMLLAAVVMPLAVFAAAEGSSADEPFRAINPDIDSWAMGSVSEVNAATGEMKIQGALLPYATAHAQMRQELRTKTAGIQDREQRRKIAAQVRKEWNDKLQAAMEQKAGPAKEFTFKAPADKDDLVILNASTIRSLPAFQKMHAGRKERMQHGEAAALESALSEGDDSGIEGQPTAYQAERAEAAREKAAESREKKVETAQDIREKAHERAEAMTAEQKQKFAERAAERREKRKEKIMAGREKLEGERLSASDLKKGDKVFVGFDKDANAAYSVIRSDAGAAQPAAQDTSHKPAAEPATAK
jgi:hypothetical protein